MIIADVLPRIEFRIPAAPTAAFYNRIHFFCAALRRLGPGYADALVRIVIGDNADIDQVRRENPWAVQYNVEWHGVPAELFSTHRHYATSDFRYCLPEPKADLVVLGDADTALIKPVAQDFVWMARTEPAIAGHMAHGPPPVRLCQGPTSRPTNFGRSFFASFPSLFPTSFIDIRKTSGNDFYPHRLTIISASLY